VARAGLGIRTSGDIFEAAQNEYEQARVDRWFCRHWTRRQGSVPSHEAIAAAERYRAEEGRVTELSIYIPKGKRKYTGKIDRVRPKRSRTVVYRERSNKEQIEDVVSVPRSLEKEFAEKERLSHG